MTPETPRAEQTPAEPLQPRHRTGLVTMVFTDLVDSVALRRQLGDQAGASLVQAHRHAMRQTLARFPDADEIETAGDSFLLLFARPSDAVKFALLVQMETRAMARDRNVPLAIRIGIHVGEVVIEEHTTGPKPRDLFGTQTDLCARVMGLAEGGQILLTRAVFDSARQGLKGEDIEGMTELAWLDHGPYLLKGINEPVEVLEVGEVGLAVLRAPPGSEKAHRQHSLRALVTPARAVTAAGVVVAAVVVGVVTRRLADRRPLDRNVVAVAPFNAIGKPLELWREGMMDVLSRALDGVGPLRTLSPTVVVRSWKGRADRTGAAELGRANGAGLAVYGLLESAGADSVRATATVFDVQGDSVLGGDIVIRDVASRMDRVLDSIAVRVFTQLRLVRPIGAAPMASLGSRSLPAIKAFLRGEQSYRRNEFAAAQTAYEEAVAADTTFALAIRRMRNVGIWFDSLTTPKLLEYGHRAGALNHGLGLRDSLLILADSLQPDPYQFRFIDLEFMARTRRRFAVLDQAAAAYPNDPEVWTELGLARVRSTRLAPDAAGALAAFERAIAADSLFGPAYPTAILIALPVRGRDATLTLTRRYLRINPSDSVRLVIEQILGGNRSDTELRRAMQAPSLSRASFVAQVVAKWRDDEETGVRLLRLLSIGREPPLGILASALRFRGHLREAAAVNDLSYRYSPERADDLLFYSRYLPAEAAALDSLSARWLADEQRVAIPVVLTRASDRHDTLTLARALGTAEKRVATGPGEPETREWQYLAGLARAYLTLARGDSAAATHAFLALPDSLAWQFTTMPAVTDAARLFVTRGLAREAVTLLDRHSAKAFTISAWEPSWNLEVARAAAITGDSARARSSYAFAAAAWKHADAALLRELENCAADLRRHGIK